MKEKIILSIALMILILSPMTIHAGDCETGSGEEKWTLYTGSYIIHLKGDVCRFDKANLQWKGIDLQGNKTYFHGAFTLRGGHHGGSRILKETPKEDKQGPGW